MSLSTDKLKVASFITDQISDTMTQDTPTPIYRKDYSPFAFSLKTIDLKFELYDERTRVSARGSYKRNQNIAGPAPLILYGEELELLSLSVNGRDLESKEYLLDEKSLTILSPPAECVVEIVTQIYPDNNSSLEGLYRSSGNYCTQCEAEGFRKISYYPDRPDVLARFTTRIEADRDLYPVMLSNGNLINQGELDANRHFVEWHDPFPKPSYLFALVAGQLVAIEDQFTTRSGKIVELKIYVEKQNREKCQHAMISLKKSMRWDEDVFGLEYDLDTFMIVAVDDFNMGAMENKGLNIFNSKYILTSPESATDQDYLGVEGVVAHEYFHNWTGNRVTCRDWFQLSLKEGLTVFRDQQFSADMNSRAVQRIDDVRILKAVQFKEDSSPMAHPVRPDSYVEINNFYTATVYNKGAEVVRMIHTLIGAESFRRGMDLYFQRHDGQAVTCDDFVAAMSDASGVDLEQFKLWYSQSGTPILNVQTTWHKDRSEYRVVIHQRCPATPGQPEKQPFHMPVTIGLLGEDGGDLLTSSGQKSAQLELKEKEQSFVFQGITEQPVLSFLRDFSAPVRVEKFQSRKELAHLAAKDSNLYNRWDSANRLSGEVILEVAKSAGDGIETDVDQVLLEAVRESLLAPAVDKALLALAIQLPSETTLAQEMNIIYPGRLHRARQAVKKTIAGQNRQVLLRLYEENLDEGDYSLTPEAMGRRNLKNVCLNYLMALEPLPEEFVALCEKQYHQSANMTDTIAALAAIVNIDGQLRDEIFSQFADKWADNPLVMDKWFSLQAISLLPDTLDRVISLMSHPAFSITNPNKVRALVSGFCSGNHYRFHDPEGRGYRFLGDRILQLNSINPQIAARLVTPLINWQRYEPDRSQLMRGELLRIRDDDRLSRDVFEIVSKSLEQ
jgi:aminopeptidase N